MQIWQNSAILVWISKILIAVIAAVVLGNGSVVLFNHLPSKWFEDDGILPPGLVEADKAGRQRLPSNPWKWAFMGLFLVTGMYLAIMTSMSYQIATLITLAVVLGMAISDQLYKTVPDQYQFLLALSAIGFVGYNEEWWEPLAGAGIGLGLGLAVLGLGALIYKRGSIGGADIKFYTCMGLVAGRRGIIVIFVLTTLLFAAESAIKIATRRGTIKDQNAMMPAAFIATLIYTLFL